MGIVVSENQAYENCVCYLLDPLREISNDNLRCWSRGVRGALKKSQHCQCKNFIIKPPTEKLAKNYQRMKENGMLMKSCLSKGVTLDDFNDCIQNELQQ